MDNRLEKYQKAKGAVESAKEWNGLPNGQKYQNDSFNISLAHCKPPQLTRCGQQSAGGTNYWETAESFNSAILEHIVENWNKIYPDIIQRMTNKEKEALKKCQLFIDKMQEEINAV